MLASPLVVDIRRGAVERLADLLTERHISADGTVLVAVGPGTGEQIWAAVGPALPKARVFTVSDASLQSAGELQEVLRERSFDALVGIGGGRTIDVAKYAATRAAVPMVAVATNLAHDGICSPVASLTHPGGKGSFGVSMPLAVVVDLDYVRAAPPQLVRSGIGDAVSNLSAIEDWQLAERERGEPLDGLAVTFARTAAEAVLHRGDGIDDDDFLIALAEALVLSGMAMSVAGTSRPCSGACHEFIHAVDLLYPGVYHHGELAGIGALFAYFLRDGHTRFDQIAGCLHQHGLPRTPDDIGLSVDEFVAAVLKAPSTRPDRYTILEHLDLDEQRAHKYVEGYLQRLG
ncbi:MAG: iron-containing alcohol dehydrogenase family protein [Actinomycetota bacterium]|nr:iron-containing alcohol dehydrogenase family protein [Actinomycetota bacterium]